MADYKKSPCRSTIGLWPVSLVALGVLLASLILIPRYQSLVRYSFPLESQGVPLEVEVADRIGSNRNDDAEIELPTAEGSELDPGNGDDSANTAVRFDGVNSEKASPRNCDLYTGKWVYDPADPLYTGSTCPIVTQAQNCQGNGRPDKEYWNWRWKPDGCELPRFNGSEFLQMMKGKKVAFVGDSVARNQMESLICALWQHETPQNRGSRRMTRWFFRSTSTTIMRIWSSWLVHKTSEPFEYLSGDIVKVHLDVPDEDFMEFVPMMDVLVLSSGHWFVKQSVYFLNGSVVGGQLWSPKTPNPNMNVDSVKAFEIATETALTALAGSPNYHGLTILRSYSPDHYFGGEWNTGGSCTGKIKPASGLMRNEHTEVMYETQARSFSAASKKFINLHKPVFMDITKPFGYRHDGHPGQYRSPNTTIVTTGINGKPPPEDCLHWCMPGAVDVWNEMLLEILRTRLGS